MKTILKRCTALSLICVMMISLVGCSLFDGKDKVYSRYLISLLDINYKNQTKDYITLTGASQKDAEAVYVANMEYQARNLMNYYGIKEVDDGTILLQFYYLAQSIFSNSKYEVTDVKHDKDADTYTLELTVYPLDTLETTYDTIVEYIEGFNARVDEGDYNNTNEVDYETEFAQGIIDILTATADEPGYMDPVVIDVPIQTSSDYYCIEDEDFLAIDSVMLYIRENPETAHSSADSEARETESEEAEETGVEVPPSEDGVVTEEE